MIRKLRDVVLGRTETDAQAWFDFGHRTAAAATTDEQRYEARHALLQAVALAPENLQRAIDAGQLLVQVRCYPEAEALYRRVLEQVPDLAPLRAELARLLVTTDRPRDALEEAELALTTMPQEQSLLLLAADLNLRTGEITRAVEHLLGVLAEDVQHLDANAKLAPLLAKLGDRAQSIQCWRQVVAQKGLADLEAMTALAIALSEDGQHAEAVELLARIASHQPDLGSAQANLGMALLAAERTEEAIVAFARALALEPASAAAHNGLGLACQRQERWSEAIDAFRATCRLSPQDPTGPLNLGITLQMMGDFEGARAALKTAAELSPADQEIKQAIARLGNARSLPAPAKRDSSGAIDASIQGDLKSFELCEVLELLRMQNKSGSLVLSSRFGAGLVRMSKGTITSASAPGVPHLGQVLLANGLVAPAALEAVLARQRGQGQDSKHAGTETLGAMLLREGLLTEAALTQVVFAQVIAALAQMCDWSEGVFSFHRDQQGAPPPVSFSVPQVVLEVMRRKDEAAEGARGNGRKSGVGSNG